MRVLLATSDVTFVPRNHQPFFDTLFERVPQHLAGLVLVRSLSARLLGTAAFLGAAGARQTARTLVGNALSLRRDPREALCRDHGLPVLRADSMNDEAIVDWVAANSIDVIANVRTRSIYRRAILGAPRLGCLNIHHGILPRYRGVLCDLHALLDGRPAGFTIHHMAPRVDAGNILVRRCVSAAHESSYAGYLARTGAVEGMALAELIAETARAQRLPEGVANQSTDPIYNRSPGLVDMWRMSHLGLGM